jgi:hypothetical protein
MPAVKATTRNFRRLYLLISPFCFSIYHLISSSFFSCSLSRLFLYYSLFFCFLVRSSLSVCCSLSFFFFVILTLSKYLTIYEFTLKHLQNKDDVDDNEVAKTSLQSLMGMVPWTAEWYEARAAEEAMDDLANIRIERVKATDLYTMTKVGKHEQALEKMMKETTYDFFYFNKLKKAKTEKGQWKFEKPDLNPYAFMDAGKDANRIKKAFNKSYLGVEKPQDSGDYRKGNRYNRNLVIRSIYISLSQSMTTVRIVNTTRYKKSLPA